MTDRTLIALVLVATMVLAGCSGGTVTSTTAPTADESTTTVDAATTTAPSSDGTTTTEDYPKVPTEDCKYRDDGNDVVEESGACLPFDADEVYERVAAMAGVDVQQGPSVNAIPARETSRYDFNFNNETFGATMGIAPDGQPSVFVPGYASPNPGPDGGVDPQVTLRYIGLWNDSALSEDLGIRYSAADAEITAAHEFLHAIQFYRGSQQRLSRNLTSEGVNVENVRLAMLEGSASFFESEYQRRHMGNPNAMRNFSAWSNASAYSMQQLGPYVAGSHYTRWYLNGSTKNFEKLYDDPAVSMEQILHKYRPDEELPKNLSVEGDVSSDWSTPSSAATKGELFLRSALRSGVSGPQAAAGAKGWGQDGLVSFQNTSFNSAGEYKRGYAWAIRFDNASEGEEFESIFGEWLASTGSQADGAYVAPDGEAYRLVEVSAETYVVLAGHQEFVRQASVDGNTTRVVVEHTGEDETSNSVGAATPAVVDAGATHVRALA